MPANVFKLLLRRRLRGWNRQERWRFRVRADWAPEFRVEVRARGDGARFQREVRLRPRTSDVPTFEQIFVRGFYDLRQLARWNDIRAGYERLAATGTPLILDLGANVGLSALVFAREFPAARILAVEPDPGNFGLLERNLAGLPQAQPVAAAVAAEDGAVRIVNPDGPTAALRTESVPAGTAGAIPALAVTSLMRQAHATAPCLPFLAKVDIEGAESGLFARDCGWVDQFPILILEPHDWMLPRQATAASFLRAIAPLNRDLVLLGESLVSIARDWPSR